MTQQRPGAPATMAQQHDVVLATLNARYIHASLGLRYLRANLGRWREHSAIVEFTTDHRPLDIVEALLLHQPRVIGLGVYVWNVRETTDVVQLLRALAPHVIIIVGGPEVSYEAEAQQLCALADHVVQGEGESALLALVEHYLGTGPASAQRVAGGLPDMASIALPYAEFTDADLADRVLYVEASRGCPYRCSFCLSSLDQQVRTVPLDALFAAFTTLLDRGARAFKFVDRTFNLSPKTSAAILQFFLDRLATLGDGLFLHFEMVPDRFPASLRQLVQEFPAGSVQFEVGVQSLNPEVLARIDRRQDAAKLFDNLAFLHNDTGVHVHCDLIVGLPGEDLASFGRGFDQLVAAHPGEIQVGILKRLRGAPIASQTQAWSMVYSPLPPYELLQSATLTAAEMARMRRFARYWDIFANSGRFRATLPLLLGDSTPFAAFLAFSDWLWATAGLTSTISHLRAVTLVKQYLDSRTNVDDKADVDDRAVGAALVADYRRVNRKSQVPHLLAAYAEPVPRGDDAAAAGVYRARAARQDRHGAD